ncbi:TPA: Rha family transcriptional regulator [Vibrio vulnificus]|nr:Rha family transcriptional regulator [Vibrio vulnificus]
MNTIKPQIASAKTSDLVFLSQSNELVTDSRWVSLYFGKPHKDVLAKIKSLSCSEQFRYANFSAHPYKHEQNGQTYEAYQMTKDGFMFLVMGFTGKRAAEIKERYINAFNEMAESLKQPSHPANHLKLPDFNHQRVLLTVDNGKVTSSRILSADEMIMNRYQYINYFKEPDVGFSDLEQLAELSRVVSERLCKQVNKHR